jgi:hypothetical protein
VHRWGAFAQSVTVTTVTVDSYVRANALERIDVIKCDVEGSEWDVLSGARETLTHNDVVVIAELAADSPHPPIEVYDLMSSLGYSAEVLDVPDFNGDWRRFEFGNVAFRKEGIDGPR